MREPRGPTRKNGMPRRERLPNIGGMKRLRLEAYQEQLKKQGVLLVPVKCYRLGRKCHIICTVWEVQVGSQEREIPKQICSFDIFRFDVNEGKYYSSLAWDIRDMGVLRYLMDRAMEYMSQTEGQRWFKRHPYYGDLNRDIIEGLRRPDATKGMKSFVDPLAEDYMANASEIVNAKKEERNDD